jgi:hypothetical protein
VAAESVYIDIGRPIAVLMVTSLWDGREERRRRRRLAGHSAYRMASGSFSQQRSFAGGGLYVRLWSRTAAGSSLSKGQLSRSSPES